MQARDMADLGHNMADGMADAMHALGRGLGAVGHALGQGLSAVGHALGALGAAFVAGVRNAATTIGEWLSTASLYIKGIMIASYYVPGQHLAPIQQEVFKHDHPPTLEAMIRNNWFGGGLAFLAFGLPAMAFAIPMAVIYNSIQSVPRAFVNPINAVLFDSPEDQIRKPNVPWLEGEDDNRNGLRKYLFGLPGLLIGGIPGLVCAGFVFVSRLLYHTMLSGVHGTVWGINHGLKQEDQLQFADTRSKPLGWGLGGLGYLLGGALGLTGAAVMIACRWMWNVASRLVVNTALATGCTAANIMDLSLHKDHEIKPNDARTVGEKAYGGLGYLLGGAIGLMATPFILLSRLIYNSVVSAGYGFIKGLNPGLHESEQIQSNDTRDDRSRFAFGGVGYLVGGLFGLVCGASVFLARRIWDVGSRLVVNTALTTGYTAANIMDLSLHKDHEIKPNDARNFGEKVYGSLGYLLGGAIGLMATPFILLSRLIYNSVVSAGYGFIKGLNPGLHESEQIQSNDTRDDRSRFAFGGVGYAVGGLFGLVGAVSVLSVRWMWDVASQWAVNTLLTTGYTAANIMDFSLHKDHQIKPTDDRTGKAKVYGGLGYLLGGVAGLMITPVILVSRLLFNSVVSVGHGFAGGLNHGLHENEQIKLDDVRDDRSRWGFGGVGYGLGGVLGLASAGVVVTARWLGRVFTNIGQSIAISFVNCLNTVLPADQENEKWQLTPIQDTRTGVNRLLSDAAGYPLGFALSLVPGLMVVIGRSIVNTLWTTGYTSAKVMNLSLHKDHQIQYHDERTLEQKAYGSLGYCLGGIAGVIATPFILASRFIYNSIVSSGHGFAFGLNLSLNEQDHIHTVDKRDDISRWGLGGFGYGVGFALGIAASSVVVSCRLIGRMLSNIAQSTAVSFVDCLNTVLPADRDNEKWQLTPVNDTRTGTGRYLAHAMGYPLGLALSLIPGAVVFVGRLLMNTFKSWGYTTAQVINQSLPNSWEIKIDDQRSRTAKIYGRAGDALGIVTGAVVSPLIWVGRLIVNSVVSGYYGFVEYYHRGVGKPADLAADTRDEASRQFGVFGYFAGGVMGLVAAAVVRLVSNTVDNFIRANVFMMNSVLHKEDEFKLAADNRPLALKAVGVMGIVGFATGAMCAGLIAIARVIKNTWISLITGLHDGYRLGAGQEPKPGDVDQRDIQTQRLGYAGYGLGGVIGAIGGLVVRIFKNSIDTASRAIVSIINPFLHGEDKLKAKSLGQDDARGLINQYGAGSPGLVVGAVCGVVAAAGIAVARLMTNTCKSFWTLSTSLFNVGLGRPVFAGWNADQRSNEQKALGILGYLAAAPIGLAAVATLFTIRKSPLIVFGLVGAAISPLMAIYKAIFEKTPDRFPTHNQGPQGEVSFEGKEGIEQGFKNIYSSLTGWGSLPAGSEIAREGNGQTSTALWWKKVFTYNFRSITEKTLDAILQGYRRYQARLNKEGNSGGDYFNDIEFNTAIVGLKEDYQSGCITDNEDVAEIHAEIDHIANFVKEYMTTHIPDVKPDLYGSRRWGASFFGAAPQGEAPGYASLPGASPKPSAPPASVVEEQPVVVHVRRGSLAMN